MIKHTPIHERGNSGYSNNSSFDGQSNIFGSHFHIHDITLTHQTIRFLNYIIMFNKSYVHVLINLLCLFVSLNSIYGNVLPENSNNAQNIKQSRLNTWPNGTIPYRISSAFNASEIEVIRNAMTEISSKTCITFEKQEQHEAPDYVDFVPSINCSSTIGMEGGGQKLYLNRDGCLNHKSVVHELLHAVGLFHEQARKDRDEHVEISWGNIMPNKTYQFNKFNSHLSNDIIVGVPYDYESIMHYSETEFITEEARLKGLSTIQAKQPGINIRPSNSMTYYDALKVIRMYCKDKENSFTTTTTTTQAPTDSKAISKSKVVSLLKQLCMSLHMNCEMIGL